MFDAVRKGFKNAVHVFEGKRELTEENIEEALKAIRLSLFEADVNFQVVKRFLAAVKEKALGEIVQVRIKDGGKTLRASPGDVFIKICHDELEALMGPVDTGLTFVQGRLGPTVIMMVGLQGAGKTTTTGKLARFVERHHQKKPLLVAADVYRPAAVEQLQVLGKRLGIPVYAEPGGNPPDIAERALAQAKADGNDVVIIDTAGRLAVDDLLMSELEEIVARVKPHNILLVVDAMIGQDAVNTAKEFNDRIELDGFIMTKLDGDARGGAALSIKEVTKKPIKFIGLGEGMETLQEFQPAGFADRILGMGDIRSLVSRIENVVTEDEMKSRESDAARMMSGQFDLNDFLSQIRMIKKMGSLGEIVEMMPFASALPDGFSVDDNELVRIEALIQSMTPDERRNPALVGNQVTRQRRIAKGSGRKLEEVTDLVQRFNMMKQVMGALSGNTGGFLSQIPGFKQLSALKNLKNLDMGSLLGGMGGKGPGGFPVMGGFPGMGGGGMPNMASLEQMFAGMQQPQQPQQPKLPKGFNMPGVRAVSEAEANRGNAEFEREKRRKLAAKLAKKKNR